MHPDPPEPAEHGDELGGPVLAWWVAADVASPVAHDGAARSGLHRFPAGTALWVLPPRGDEHAEYVVVADARPDPPGSGAVRAVVPRRHLTRFRVRGVHSPATLRRLTEQITLGWPARMWEGVDQAAAVASRWNDESRSAS